MIIFNDKFSVELVSATRNRLADEIIPVKAEHSAARNNDEATNGAGNAIDLVLDTISWTLAGTDGQNWLKIILDQVHCIEQLIWIKVDGTPLQTWTCVQNDCESCVGDQYCDQYTTTIITEGVPEPDLSLVQDCSYGDTVKFQRQIGGFKAAEFAVIGKKGKFSNFVRRIL